jgi:crotonobetainyl-CoA:carnitine CoA-transferase CaiB-like acyl-CoA transferase
MDQKGVPCAPVNNYPEILDDDHVRHMNLVHEIELPNGATTQTVAFPIGISGYQFEINRPPPKLGKHTEEVFAEWTAK